MYTQVYTKGACSSLKSAFEEHIAAKKAALQVQELPTPMTREAILLWGHHWESSYRQVAR